MKKTNSKNLKGLSPKTFPKNKRWMIEDTDYINQLTEDEKAYLATFNDEFHGNTHFNKADTLHKDPEHIRDLYRSNNSVNRDLFSIQASGQALVHIEDLLESVSENPEDALVEYLDSKREQEKRPSFGHENKKFERSVFEENDEKARDWCKSFFANSSRIDEDYYLTENPDKYGIDLIIRSKLNESFVAGFVETEIKHNWKGSEFPFKTIDIPERKRKMFEKNENSFMCMWNSTGTHCLFIPGSEILKAQVIRKLTKNNSGMEPFLRILFDESYLHKRIG